MSGAVVRSHHVTCRHDRIIHMRWHICPYRLLLILLLLVVSWSVAHVVVREHVPGVKHVVTVHSRMGSFPEHADVARVCRAARRRRREEQVVEVHSRGDHLHHVPAVV